MKPPLVILTGPTAVGKTELSIQLANELNGSIISADSMQIYRYMDIGTAKISTDEMQGIPHYLVDQLNPDDEFNVMEFQRMAKEALVEIYAQGKIPIVVGGTGFYIQALVNDIQFTKEETNHSIRNHYERIAIEQGDEYLHHQLQEIDPESARSIHANNRKRVIRALEYYELTGSKFSDHNENERNRTSPYHFVYHVLTNERPVLYHRIDARVDQMIEQGLVQEVDYLLKQGYARELVSMQGLGYKEIAAYLYGECSLEEAIYILKRDTRHFAKRQLTWFRRESNVIWWDKSKYKTQEQLANELIDYTKEYILRGEQR